MEKTRGDVQNDFLYPKTDNPTVESARQMIRCTQATNNEAQYLRDFITKYEELSCLWNPEDEGYRDKETRLASLGTLRGFYEKIKPGADIEDVKRKINTLRSNYKKELKKIEVSKLSGGRIYNPSSWVFHALTFLTDIEKQNNERRPELETQRDEMVKLEDEEDLAGEEYNEYQQQLPLETSYYNHISNDSYPDDDQYGVGDLLGPGSLQTARSSRPATSTLKTLKRSSTTQAGPPWKSSKLESTVRTSVPAIINVWTEKLISLEGNQRLLAEKAINDILFEAAMGTLHRNYRHEFMPDPDGT